MKVLSLLLFVFIFVFEACSTLDRQEAAKECKYMIIQYPRAQKMARLVEMTLSQCQEIRSKIIETAGFLSSYEFVRIIQSEYPPSLTLVVLPKKIAPPNPVLIKSGGARDRVFTAVDHSVDYTGRVHRYAFGRYAVEALQGIVEEGWNYRLVLSLDSTGN